MARPSVTTLSAVLVKVGFVTKPFTTRDLRKGVSGVSDETYGTSSHVYLHTTTPAAKTALVKALAANGINCNREYSGSSVDVPVTYFKGFHWDE